MASTCPHRTQRVEDGVVETFSYDQRNQVLSDGEGIYNWKARGTLNCRTVNGVTHDYWYDAFGRLGRIRVGSDPYVYFHYDGLGRIWRRYRATSTPESQVWVYGGLTMEGSRTNGNVGIITYGRTPGGRLHSQRDRQGNQRYAGLNQHGDLTWLAPNNGANPTETVAYSPYGEVLRRWGSDPNPEVGYQGQYTDPDTGDVNMQARWYGPSSGSFRSRDTYAGQLQTPVSLNRYTYAHNNPIRYSDVTGYCPNPDRCGDAVRTGGLESSEVADAFARSHYGGTVAGGSSAAVGETLAARLPYGC